MPPALTADYAPLLPLLLKKYPPPCQASAFHLLSLLLCQWLPFRFFLIIKMPFSGHTILSGLDLTFITAFIERSDYLYGAHSLFFTADVQ